MKIHLILIVNQRKIMKTRNENKVKSTSPSPPKNTKTLTVPKISVNFSTLSLESIIQFSNSSAKEIPREKFHNRNPVWKESRWKISKGGIS